MKLPVCTSEGLPEAECPITDGESLRSGASVCNFAVDLAATDH